MIASEHSAPMERSRRHVPAAIFALAAAWISCAIAPSSYSALHVHAFSPSTIIVGRSATRQPNMIGRAAQSRLYSETAADEGGESLLPPPSDMRLREIQSELKESNISYADCFDRESLVKRLIEARDGLVELSIPPPEKVVEQTQESEKAPPVTAEDEGTTTSTQKETTTADAESTEDEKFDRETTLSELRTLRVKELKEKLSGFKVRWGTMIEKEEMVQALCNAMEERFEMSKNFSRSGALIPGTVVDVEESALLEELGWLESDLIRGVATQSTAGDGSSSHPPILLDVYATWCGPCQFLAPLLVEAAEELGPTVRMVKLDSDKYPRISSVLKVGGLPTLIRFDGGDVSKEVQRVEGALTKDQIIDFVNGNFNR